MKSKLILVIVVLSAIFQSCNSSQPRKPVKARGASFIETSIERNKALVAQEESFIKKLIALDSIQTYKTSTNGFWYTVLNENKQSNYAKENDIVIFNYEVRDLGNNIIYNAKDIGKNKFQVNNVNKEVYFPGLRASLLLLRKGEKGVFYFPSAMAYGYHGDKNKIDSNIPLKVTISISDINTPKNSIIN
jgi:gliding motility-associated peptidyl-prolyl isomerase